MDQSAFDALTQRVSRLKTRRSTLAGLLGGAFLLHGAAPSEATDKAKRRKKRERKQENRSASHRGRTILVDNTAGTRSVTVGPGGIGEGMCCAAGFTETIAAGSSKEFSTHFATGWVNINQKYWFQVTNPLIGRPYLAIALSGAFYGHNTHCCQGQHTGLTVEYQRTFTEGQSRSYDIRGPVFTVTRNRDRPNHKLFTIKLPATI